DQAIATRTVRGGTVAGYYPFNRYARVELSGGLVQYNEEYSDPSLQQYSEQYQQQQYGSVLFRNGTMVPLSVAFVSEDTIFRDYGPLSGKTMRLAYDVSPKIGNTLSRQAVDLDARWYQRLAGNGVAAFRLKGFRSWGSYPDFFYFGGNSE